MDVNKTSHELQTEDPLLKDLPIKKYSVTATKEVVEKTKAALEAKGHVAVVVSTKAEALEYIKSTIPKGSSVHNAGSHTLKQVGFSDYFKTQTEWKNLHAEILAEQDQGKSAELRRLAGTADWFLTSFSAVSAEGDLLSGDATGTRNGPIVHSAGHVIAVIGTNKIVPTYNDAVVRTEEYALPLESARARLAYGHWGVKGSAINTFIAIRGSSPWSTPKRIHVVIVTEELGF